jgi:hypothetical protein
LPQLHSRSLRPDLQVAELPGKAFGPEDDLVVQNDAQAEVPAYLDHQGILNPPGFSLYLLGNPDHPRIGVDQHGQVKNVLQVFAKGRSMKLK